MAKELGSYIDDLLGEVGEPQTWEGANRLVQAACLRLGRDRHQDYGPNNIKKFGVSGVVIRLHDKLERATTMIFGNSPQSQLTAIDAILEGNYKNLEDMIAEIRNVRSVSSSREESLEDSLGDTSNYGVYGVMLERGWWELPLATDQQELDHGDRTNLNESVM